METETAVETQHIKTGLKEENAMESQTVNAKQNVKPTMESQTVETKQPTQLITESMTIGDVITKHPSTVEVLLRHGVHCVGCGAKTFETLGDGFRGHGFSEEKIAQLIKELNESVEDLGDQPTELQITSKAAAKLKDLIKQNNKEGHGLRVQVLPGGCAGFQYGFDFENTPKENDTVIDVDGVKFYVDAQSMNHLSGARIDYVDTLQEAGFRISNPNASSGCGCGKSFS